MCQTIPSCYDKSEPPRNPQQVTLDGIFSYFLRNPEVDSRTIKRVIENKIPSYRKEIDLKKFLEFVQDKLSNDEKIAKETKYEHVRNFKEFYISRYKRILVAFNSTT